MLPKPFPRCFLEEQMHCPLLEKSKQYFFLKAATVLAKSTLKNQNCKATTLPMDFHYEVDTLVQLHLKPGTRVRLTVSSFTKHV